MTFAARGLVVALAFFAVVYCSLSTLVVVAWQGAERLRMNERTRERFGTQAAGLLFGLRIFSFATAGVVTAFFTFPSFWMMERRSLDEDGGTFILAACALVIVAAGLFRLLRDRSRTTRALREWLLRSWNPESEVAKPALDAASGAPALILSGVLRPRIMVSDAAAQVLSADELRAAMRHELGHRRSLDNLKKVLISATPFPGMRSLDGAWRDAAELAADDAAVGNRQDALDLAAALIKLSRSSKQTAEPALVSGLGCGSSSVTVRIERLLRWRASAQRLRGSWRVTLLLALAVGAVVVSHYDVTLVWTHRLTELLVP